VLAFAFLLESISFWYVYREFKRHRWRRGFWEAFRASKNPSVFMVLAEDFAAMVGLGISCVGISASRILRMPVLDGIASCLIGLVLGLVALLLAYESRDLLLGESAHPELLEFVKRISLEERGVERIGPPLTMHFGPNQVLLNMEVRFRADMEVQEMALLVKRIEDRIRKAFPEVKRIFIEANESPQVSFNTAGSA